MLGGGYLYPQSLLHHTKNIPPVPTKVKRLHYGYLVISLSRTVRLGYSYSDHMFLALREPSVVVFNKLRVAPPSSFATLESPAAPEGSCHNLREYGSERSSEPSGSVMCGNPQRRPSTSFEGLRLFHPSPSRCPKHNEDSGHHLRTPYLDELFDASSSSVNLQSSFGELLVILRVRPPS